MAGRESGRVDGVCLMLVVEAGVGGIYNIETLPIKVWNYCDQQNTDNIYRVQLESFNFKINFYLCIFERC